jgi:hypothetical protein
MLVQMNHNASAMMGFKLFNPNVSKFVLKRAKELHLVFVLVIMVLL